jgi:putative effector of murein hydrolase
MAWMGSRRNQLLLGGSVGALAGGLFAHFASVEQALLPVLVGFALGQVVAVVAAPLLQPNRLAASGRHRGGPANN